MPIYEFRCLSCNHCFELLSVRKDDTLEMKCPSCEGEEVERVLSCVSYVMGSSSSSGDSDKTRVTTKSCGGGQLWHHRYSWSQSITSTRNEALSTPQFYRRTVPIPLNPDIS